MRTRACAASTWPSAVRSSCCAWSNTACGGQPPFRSSSWRAKARRAWIPRAPTAPGVGWFLGKGFRLALRVEPCHDLAALDDVTDVDAPLDDASIEPKSQLDLVL